MVKDNSLMGNYVIIDYTSQKTVRNCIIRPFFYYSLAVFDKFLNFFDGMMIRRLQGAL